MTKKRRTSTKQYKYRAIIVKFLAHSTKDDIYSKRKELKHKMDGVFINEDLTNHRNKLFKLARELRSDNKIMGTWTTNGKVRVKMNSGTNITVNNELDLKNI